MTTAILFSATVFCSIAADPGKSGLAAYGQWEKVHSSEGVTSWVRWVRFSDGTKTRERKGDFSVDGTFQGVMSMLTDAGSTKKWVAGVAENYRITVSGNNTWVTYTLYDLPWPFQRRDLVSTYSVKPEMDRHAAVIAIHSNPGLVPQKPGVERLSDYNARWNVTETATGRIHVTFTAMSDTPPLFPRFIQDPVIESVFQNNLVRLKAMLSESASAKQIPKP